MIQANELRIGNIVSYADVGVYIDDIIGTPHIICEEDFGMIRDGVIKYYDPIPLTDEILSKCPCLKKGKNPDGQTTFHAMKSHWEIKWTIEHWKKSKYNEDCFFIYGLGTIKYLHELQNYYWMKEKKELEVEL